MGEANDKTRWPLLSVIVPFYGVERYFAKCLESLIAQSYPCMEILLVDDGSKDGSRTIAERFAANDGRIRILTKENGGLSSARNFGLREVKGGYVAFVDSDDWLAPRTYERMMSVMDSGKYDVVTCGFVRTADENATPKKDGFVEIEKIEPKAFVKSLLKVGAQDADQYAWDKIYRREVLGDDPFPEGLTDEDVEGAMRIALNARRPFAKLDFVGYFYRVNPDSITAPTFGPKKLDFLTVCDHVKELADASGDAEIALWADAFRKRADFAILGRLLTMEVPEDERDLAERTRIELLTNLKRNRRFLNGWSWPLSRKLAMNAMCASWPLAKAALGRKRS